MTYIPIVPEVLAPVVAPIVEVVVIDLSLVKASNLSDVPNAGVARTSLGLGSAATTSSGDYAPVANGVTNGNSHDHSGGDGAAIVEAAITLVDNTTNDVSTARHGFAPKGDGSTTKFLNANGAYSTPAGGGASATRTVINASFPAQRTKKVNVVDATVTATSQVMAWVSGLAESNPNSGDMVDVHAIRATAKTGSFDLDLDFLTPWAGSLSIDYAVFA